MGRTEFRLRLLQPEAHVHLVVHRCGDRHVLGGLCLVTDAMEQLAEAGVAVGLERAHAQLLGRHERLTIVGRGALDLGGIAMHGDITEEPLDIGEASALSSLLREVPRAQGHLGSLVQPANQEIPLTGPHVHTCHIVKRPRFREILRRTLIQQG
jgi:hypothetical protein